MKAEKTSTPSEPGVSRREEKRRARQAEFERRKADRLAEQARAVSEAAPAGDSQPSGEADMQPPQAAESPVAVESSAAEVQEKKWQSILNLAQPSPEFGDALAKWLEARGLLSGAPVGSRRGYRGP